MEIELSQTQISLLIKQDKAALSRKISNLDIPNRTEGMSKKFGIENVRYISTEILKIKEPKKKVIHCYNYKGGTGKTVVSVQLAQQLVLMGFSVLFIDWDPQGHSTINMGYDNKDKKSLADVIINQEDINSIIVQDFLPGLDLIPSCLKLSMVDTELLRKNNRDKVLQKYIDPLRVSYDYIIIDSNPSISLMNKNALLVSDLVLIVTQTEANSIDGLIDLEKDIKTYEEDMGIKIDYRFVANQYTEKLVSHQEMLGRLRSEYKDRTLVNIIRKSEDINQTTLRQAPISSFAKINSPGLNDIIDIVHEIAILTGGLSANNSKIVQ